MQALRIITTHETATTANNNCQLPTTPTTPTTTTTTTTTTATIDYNDATTIQTMRQRYDNQPRTNLEATLMARHPELQAEAERLRWARQEEEQASR